MVFINNGNSEVIDVPYRQMIDVLSTSKQTRYNVSLVSYLSKFLDKPASKID